MEILNRFCIVWGWSGHDLGAVRFGFACVLHDIWRVQVNVRSPIFMCHMSGDILAQAVKDLYFSQVFLHDLAHTMSGDALKMAYA
jgi:hypothetical protein